jgi:hypothetical protein
VSRSFTIARDHRYAGERDEDGDVIVATAQEDFRKECAAMLLIDSPRLLKIFGFGTTEIGTGFIVSELMANGSLEDVLHNQKRPLPWRTRLSISHDVAVGMEFVDPPLFLNSELRGCEHCYEAAQSS